MVRWFLAFWESLVERRQVTQGAIDASGSQSFWPERPDPFQLLGKAMDAVSLKNIVYTYLKKISKVY